MTSFVPKLTLRSPSVAQSKIARRGSKVSQKASKKFGRCCRAGKLKCTACWKSDFAQCTRDRVRISELHQLYNFNKELIGSKGLAPVITGEGIPTDVRGVILGMLEEQEEANVLRAHDAITAHTEKLEDRTRRARIYTALCDQASQRISPSVPTMPKRKARGPRG